MLSRKFIPFLLFLIKMSVTQTVYPTTAVTYSSNSVPTVQTLPASTTVTTVPTVTATAAPTIASATTMPTTIRTTPISATLVPSATTPIPASSSSMGPTVTVTATPISPTAIMTSPMPTASQPKVTISPTPCKDTEPKAYFLPTNIPDPKVTILSTDLPSFAEIKPVILDDPELIPIKACQIGATPSLRRKDNGPMTAVKRVTMACTDEVPFLPNEDTVCPGITKIDPIPIPTIKNKDLKSNPIDFDGLIDGFMSCL